MTDTIELLEAIGSDASLRYAQADELQAVLEQAQASMELVEAVAQGNGVPLRVELCIRQVEQAPQIQAPGHGDDEEEETEVPPPKPREPDKSPSHPPAKQPD